VAVVSLIESFVNVRITIICDSFNMYSVLLLASEKESRTCQQSTHYFQFVEHVSFITGMQLIILIACFWVTELKC